MANRGVRTEHADYTDMLPQWTMCSDLEKGQRAVHKAGERYLPKLEGEEASSYSARIKRSDYFNAYYRTINGLVGMAFRKDPVIDLPASIDPFAKNIDLAGKTLLGMAKDVCEEMLEYGRVGLLVDHPPMPENVSAISQAAAEDMGLRPAIKKYDARCIINWRYRNVGNMNVLVRVVLKEQEMVDVDEWEQKAEDRYRVLDLNEDGVYRQRVFRIVDENTDELMSEIIPLMNGKTINFIPFVFIDPNGVGGAVEEPPLVDLAYRNIAHYQINSDLRASGHLSIPTYNFFGVEPDEVESGVSIGGRANLFRNPEAKVVVTEPTNEGASLNERLLDRNEHQMAVLGAQMIVEQVATKTATEAAINKADENSIMASIVIAISDAFEWALRIMSQWSGASGDVVFQISREFNPLGLSAQQFTAYMQAVQQGLMSEQEFFELNQRSDIIAGDKTFEEHQEEISQQALPAPSGIVAA